MDAYTKWAQKPETKAKIASAKQSAWKEFTKQFPNADKTKFVAQTDVDNKWNITVEIFFKEVPDSLQSVFGSDRKYWSQKMKTALGLAGVGGFPYQLSPLKTKNALPIPSVDFAEPAPSLKKIFNNSTKIYVTPDYFFVTKFREIFQKTKPRHNSASEAKRWLGGPNMNYWPQQLNFAVFCATQGCGISQEIFDSGLNLPEQIRAFYKFHVYFTARRILFQMGGVQSKSALPNDPPFNVSNNPYDIPSYKKICAGFRIDPSSDFRFTGGKNNGLGNVYIWPGPEDGGFSYPGWMKFSDEGGKINQRKPDRFHRAG